MMSIFNSGSSAGLQLVGSSSQNLSQNFFQSRRKSSKLSKSPRNILLKKIDQTIDKEFKLIRSAIRIKKSSWLKNVQKLYGERNFSRAHKIIVKNVDRLHISGNDILEVSLNDFDRKPRYPLTPMPLRSHSEKTIKRHNDFFSQGKYIIYPHY